MKHTLRTRLSVNAYLANLTNMLRHWSLDTLKEKLFVKVTKLLLQLKVGSWPPNF